MRNILNHADVMQFCESLTGKQLPHIRDWATSTLYRWVLNVAPVTKPVIDSCQLNNPLVMLLGEIVNQSTRTSLSATEPFMDKVVSKFHAVNVSNYEPWLKAALERFDRVEWVDLEALSNNYPLGHWLDFMATLPKRQVKYSVPDLVEAVNAWDRLLAKQKLLSSLNEGVEVIAELPATEGHDLVLVKLVSEEAYHNEGAVMHHCVGRAGYYHKHGVQIWSLRSPQSETPLATIEVFKNSQSRLSVVQIKAKSNASPPNWVLEALNSYFDEHSVVKLGEYSEEAAKPERDIEDVPLRLLNQRLNVTPVKRVRRKAIRSDEGLDTEEIIDNLDQVYLNFVQAGIKKTPL